MDAYDIDESKVEIVNVVSDAASVFTTGEADAWLTLYYNVVYYENQGLGVDVENTVTHPEMAGLWTVTGRNDFLQESPDAAVAVLKALQRAKRRLFQSRRILQCHCIPDIGWWTCSGKRMGLMIPLPFWTATLTAVSLTS